MDEELEVGQVEERLAILGAEFGLTPEQSAGFRSKAAAWRGLIAALEAKGYFDEVVREVPAPVRVLMKNPPLGAVWMPAIAFQYVFRALSIRLDDNGMRQLARHSLIRGPMKTMKPVIEGMLRLFGAKPINFLRRTPGVMERQLEGVKFEFFESQSENEASMHIDYYLLRDLPRECFTYWEGVFTTVFDICGIDDFSTEVEIEPGRHAATIRFRWA